MRRFSKLKKQIDGLFDPVLNMEFCCSSYPMRSKTGYATRSLPRFYIKLDGKITWDFPKDFDVENMQHGWISRNGISDLVREYIDTPVDELLHKEFSVGYADHKVATSLTDIFKMADRRFGKKKVAELGSIIANYSSPVILVIRLYGWEGLTVPWHSQ